MKNVCFVGIDTSNYTTSAALCDGEGNIIANLKSPLSVKQGERGLRQSDAVFAHIKNLPALMRALFEKIGDRKVAAIGVSAYPRDAKDSYMPCFLSGVAAANSFSAGAGGIPVFEFSHQSGHIMAALYSSGALGKIDSDFAAFHVSGGTTEIILAKNDGDSFSVELIGGTEDLNAGQAIDRAGVMMGLKFPCGREMESLALENKGKIPCAKISVKGLGCNLSGLENLASKIYSESSDKAFTSAVVFDFVGKTLVKLSENLTETFGEIPIVYAGGVMSNSIIKNMLSKRKNTFFATPEFSADNAAGTALLCRRKYLSQNETE